MLSHDFVLKGNDLFLVGDVYAERSGESASGLYARDTRCLHRFELSIDGIALYPLDVRSLGLTRAIVMLSNRKLTLPDGDTLPARSVIVEQHITLDACLQVRFILSSFTGRALSLRPTLEIAADFRDLFDVRGKPRPHGRGQCLPPRVSPEQVVLGYVGLDNALAETVILFDRRPAIKVIEPDPTGSQLRPERRKVIQGWPSSAPPLPAVLEPHISPPTSTSAGPAPPSVMASFETTLSMGQSWELNVAVSPNGTGALPPLRLRRPVEHASAHSTTVTSDNALFNRVLECSSRDLAALETDFPDGWLPAAGVPWFVAPFGRDCLITGLQTLHVAPRRAMATLYTLAALQGTKLDPWRDEERGKILHEMRYGEMARLKEIPYAPYYGTVDATPLFVLLFAETVAWTRSDELYGRLLPNVCRALEWMGGPGDPDGDGLIEYQSRSPDGIRIINQGWKDTHESLRHIDGTAPTGAIALVEVQGYAYAAYRRLAEVVAARGEATWSTELRQRAETVRLKVEEMFWLEPEGFYAQALDGDERPVRMISSNPGHLLFCGLPSPGRAARLTNRLRQPDLDSGWGIRTLSSTMPTYNPASYHNGSVWPHDNSLIAAGLYRYSQFDAANHITEALFAAASSDPIGRVSELYCGFARTSDVASEAPVPQPESCRPQAWAAGANHLLVRAMLGLNPDLERRRLLVYPNLPASLNEIEIPSMELFGVDISLSIQRDDTGYRVSGDGPVEITLGSSAPSCNEVG